MKITGKEVTGTKEQTPRKFDIVYIGDHKKDKEGACSLLNFKYVNKRIRSLYN